MKDPSEFQRYNYGSGEENQDEYVGPADRTLPFQEEQNYDDQVSDEDVYEQRRAAAKARKPPRIAVPYVQDLQ